MALGARSSSVRQRNRDRVLAALRDTGSLPQIELARVTGLSPATVSNLVRELSDEGWVSVSHTVHNGRQARRVSLAAGSGLVAGIDLAHRHLRVAVAGADYAILDEDATALTGSRALEDDLERAAGMLAALLRNQACSEKHVLAIGVGVPAPIDPGTGNPMPDASLTGWRAGEGAARRIAAAFGAPIHLENDANLGLLGESVWGAARGHDEVAYVHIATGIGAGLMAAGRILHGARGMAGELGHNTVDENGPLCRCGNRGCVDVYASTPAILRVLRERHGVDLELTDLLRLIRERDHAALRVVEDAGRYVGLPVANLCNLLNPEMVLIGGDLVTAGDALLDPIRNAVRRHTMPGAGDAVEILTGTLGERATVLGAVIHAARRSHVPARPTGSRAAGR